MRDITFGQFRLDFANECLWQGARSIPLRPKAFAVLKVLLENPGQLVSKQRVLDAVWPSTFVGDAVLKDNIRQLREAMDDNAGAPRYIETAHRRGYRFIAPLGTSKPSDSPPATLDAPSRDRETAARIGCTELCTQVPGRDAELIQLHGWLARALSGERQTIFVTGEAGIGKTTVVQAFLEQAAQCPNIVVVRGQCLEHFGSGEAYLPLLDGFSRLCRSASGPEAREVLRTHAPAWLAHMSPSAPQPENNAAQSIGTTRERMLREMAEAIEQLSSRHPLLLILEDLHWSDYSTLDVVSYLARRRDFARLMIIGTYRPVDAILAAHPLRGVKRELQAHGLCHELPLEYLTEEAIEKYLSARFPGHQLPSRVRRAIYRRTEGNPLFMVSLVEYLVEQKTIVDQLGTWKLCSDLPEIEAGVPSSIRELIEKQIERLSPEEREVLESASATGVEFSTVAVAAGLERPTDWVEKHCEALARRHQFLSPGWLAELPDGTVTPRYRFNHVLYREVPYNLVPAMRRARIHQRIAERAVAIFKERASEIAAELAMHFEQSRDWSRAAQYLLQAATTAIHRSAHHEAAELARRGLEVLEKLPETSQRWQQEVTLRIMLSVSLMSIRGFVAAEMEKIYALARKLLWLNEPSPQLFNMLILLMVFYEFTGRMNSAREIAAQLTEVAHKLDSPALIMEAHRAMGAVILEQGRYADALAHFDEACRLYPDNRNHPYKIAIIHDCRVVSECFAGRALWALGDRDGALERTNRARGLAKDLCHAPSWAFASHFAAALHQQLGEPLLVQERAQEVVRLAEEHGLDLWQALGTIDLGWAQAELGNSNRGIDQMQRGLTAYMKSGARLWCPQLLGRLADQLAKAGRESEAVEAFSRAVSLAEKSNELYLIEDLRRSRQELQPSASAVGD